MAGAGGAASCNDPSTVVGSCSVVAASVCSTYFSGAGVSYSAIQTTCAASNGTSSTSACATTGQFLGCCLLTALNVKNCYYGAESLKATYALGCNAGGGSFCE